MATATTLPPLHSLRPLRRRHLNRLFAAVYAAALLCLLRHHTHTILTSTTTFSLLASFSLLIADLLLAYMWSNTQAYRMNPVVREEFPENLEKVLDRRDFPATDVFICTADPHKEPPVTVVNTALSVMAYDFPAEKLSVYVSDDGGSELTVFALMEAAKFGKRWLAFCRENDVADRSPGAYFGSGYDLTSEAEEVKMMYENMKMKVENVVERGKVCEEYITSEDERRVLEQYWAKDFTRQNHPSIINILLDSKSDRDVRVSASMTNSPIILTLDCDMYSNDPQTVQRALCYLLDKSCRPNCGPSKYIQPEIPELGPDCVVGKPIDSEEVLKLAHRVAGCTYENQTKWGSMLGFRYGSLVEDYYTGYRLQCEGWQSIFCNPSRPAFLGDVPISLLNVLNQNRRWSIGLLEVAFSKYSPLTFGIKSMGILMGQSYAHYAFWPIWAFPITVYAFIPSLTLLHGIPIFPKVDEPTFLLYLFLFIGSYTQDCFDFIFTQGTLLTWWSDQRNWLLRGLSSYLFGFIEYVTNLLSLASSGFHLTDKVLDDELSKRYDQGIFEFGVASPMFVPLATATIINLVAFVCGFARTFVDESFGTFFVQIFIAGFGVVNALPIYEAMVLRRDNGRMPSRVTISSALLAVALYGVASLFRRA
ncbi:cellulose synthase-like protein [Striga asiatica]|uniref:Cellulose synthase-like protein n=1 Tax=Striga asiatica TaxID=4170 RepID=A0A5A7RGI2_STRAF|nr:cellulose synthase-like protein [Striga asiatica]